MGGCDHATHDVLRANPYLFYQATTPAGAMDDGDERLELGHCRQCCSTLALVTPRSAA